MAVEGGLESESEVCVLGDGGECVDDDSSDRFLTTSDKCSYRERGGGRERGREIEIKQ